MHIGGSDDGCLSVTKTMPKNSQKPKSFKVKVTKKGKNFRRTAARLQKDVHAFRPDLKVCSKDCGLVVAFIPVHCCYSKETFEKGATSDWRVGCPDSSEGGFGTCLCSQQEPPYSPCCSQHYIILMCIL